MIVLKLQELSTRTLYHHAWELEHNMLSWKIHPGRCTFTVHDMFSCWVIWLGVNNSEPSSQHTTNMEFQSGSLAVSISSLTRSYCWIKKDLWWSLFWSMWPCETTVLKCCLMVPARPCSALLFSRAWTLTLSPTVVMLKQYSCWLWHY